MAGPGLQAAAAASPKERTACFVGRAMPHMQVRYPPRVSTRFSSGMTPPVRGPVLLGLCPTAQGADGTQSPEVANAMAQGGRAGHQQGLKPSGAFSSGGGCSGFVPMLPVPVPICPSGKCG